MKYALAPLAAVVAAALTAGPTAAAVLYTDRAAFEADATSLTLIDFNDQVVPPDTFTFYPGATVTLSGVTFTGNSNLYTVDPAFVGDYDLGDGVVLSFQQADPGPQVLTIDLPAGTTAVGFDFGIAFGTADFTFTLASGEEFVLSAAVAPTDDPTFAGFIADTPIASVTVTVPVDSFTAPLIDRFVFGTGVAAVPEPTSLALVGMGAAGLVGYARRRKAVA
ncbi:MAG: PEP-CTERM sorting domain-containing protein [Gemmataceae bacterium]|nr:PEP-CTERM sorting domain-containing protein [Gemmataceae bacterium]